MEQKSASNIEGVQYLRGIAALMVVAVHIGTLLPATAAATAFGVAGVDIFFVISGFIMAHATRQFDAHQTRTRQCIEFVQRRFLRVVPLYWIALLWTIKVPLAKGDFQPAFALDFLFIPRMHPSGNLWPELIAGWTINYEIFFYALFGLAMLAGRLRYVLITGALCTLVAIGMVVNPTAPVAAFYTSPIVLEFVYGLLLYQLTSGIKVSRLVSLPALAVGTFVLLLPNGSLHRAVADGLPAVLIVWAAAQAGRGTEIAPFRLLGDASYSTYLFHLAALSLIERAMHAGGLTALKAVPAPVAFVAVMLLVVMLGLAIYRWVEVPLLEKLKRYSTRSDAATSARTPGAGTAPTP